MNTIITPPESSYQGPPGLPDLHSLANPRNSSFGPVLTGQQSPQISSTTTRGHQPRAETYTFDLLLRHTLQRLLHPPRRVGADDSHVARAADPLQRLQPRHLMRCRLTQAGPLLVHPLVVRGDYGGACGSAFFFRELQADVKLVPEEAADLVLVAERPLAFARRAAFEADRGAEDGGDGQEYGDCGAEPGHDVDLVKLRCLRSEARWEKRGYRRRTKQPFSIRLFQPLSLHGQVVDIHDPELVPFGGS